MGKKGRKGRGRGAAKEEGETLGLLVPKDREK